MSLLAIAEQHARYNASEKPSFVIDVQDSAGHGGFAFKQRGSHRFSLQYVADSYPQEFRRGALELASRVGVFLRLNDDGEMILVGAEGELAPQPGVLYWSSSVNEPPDVNLYRSAEGILATDGVFVAEMGFGSSMTQPAASTGTLTGKVPFFNETGAFVGFIPLYATIT